MLFCLMGASMLFEGGEANAILIPERGEEERTPENRIPR